MENCINTYKRKNPDEINVPERKKRGRPRKTNTQATATTTSINIDAPTANSSISNNQGAQGKQQGRTIGFGTNTQSHDATTTGVRRSKRGKTCEKCQKRKIDMRHNCLSELNFCKICALENPDEANKICMTNPHADMPNVNSHVAVLFEEGTNKQKFKFHVGKVASIYKKTMSINFHDGDKHKVTYTNNKWSDVWIPVEKDDEEYCKEK